MSHTSVERALRTDLTRRNFLKASALGLLGGPAFLAACSAAATPAPSASASAASSGAATVPGYLRKKASGSIVVNVQTGALADAEKKVWVTPFVSETGIQVTPDERSLTRDLLDAMVKTGQGLVDVQTAIDNTILTADSGTYFEPIDFSVINRDEYDPKMVSENWVGATIFSWVLGYNTKATGGKIPGGWADLFDLEKFPGKRGIGDDFASAFLIALIADGVDPAKLYPMDVDRAIAKLKTIKSNAIIWGSGSDAQNLLATGEMPIGVTFNGRVRASFVEGAPVGAVWDNQLIEFDRAAVTKGTKNKDAAMAFIAYMTGKEHSGDITKYFPYPPSNKLAPVDPVAVPWLPTSHYDVPHVVVDRDYINAQYDKFNPLWQTYKTS